MQIEKLLEEQEKEFVKKYNSSVLLAYPEYAESHMILLTDIWNWHKQSLKQFIDGLVEKTEKDRNETLENRGLNSVHPLITYVYAKNETLLHLKEITKQIRVSMKIQQQVAEKIYELLPHKKELQKTMESYGYSQFDFAVSLRGVPEIFWEKVPDTATEAIRREQFENHIKYHVKSQLRPLEEEIIGQPIRLAEILIATEKRWRTMYGVNPIDGLKRDVPLREGVMIYEICSKYDLSKDNILEQSDEFCEFALELLK